MAELLIRTADKPTSGSVYQDVQRLGAGDVVCIVEDGHQWSKKERENPDWQIVVLKGVPVAKLSAVLAPDPGFGDAEAMKVNRVLRRRAFKIDVAALSNVRVRDDLAAPDKAEATAISLVLPAPAVRDPAILGTDKRVIG